MAWCDRRERTDTRAQARSLEGVAAAFIVVGAVVFALQSAVVTPLTSSTANQFLEDRQETLADDTLGAAAGTGELREALLYWNTTSKRFDGATANGYSGAPPVTFGDRLASAFEGRRVAYNVMVYHQTPAGAQRTPMVYQGTPSDNAVAASTYVTLYDTDALSAPGFNSTLANTSNFYAGDQSASAVYNVVEVRVIVWQR